MNLFQLGEFKLASGAVTNWKVECDALTKEDWDAIALMLYEVVEPYDLVVGVPRGGLPLSEAMKKYAKAFSTNVSSPTKILIVDDVYTTGVSMGVFLLKCQERFIDAEFQGAVAFARSAPPDWIVPLWGLYPRVHY